MVALERDACAQVYARRALEAFDPDNELLLADIAAKFKEKHTEIWSLARSLHSAYSHVYRSAMGGLMAVV